MHVSASIEIQSTPARVFDFLKSPEKAMLWQTSVTGAEVEHETAELVGTTGREVLSDARGSLEMQSTVTRLEPDHLIAFLIESRLHTVDVEYCLEPSGKGVSLTQRALVRWKFPLSLLMLIIGGKTRRSLIDQMQADLARLKHLCEASQSP